MPFRVAPAALGGAAAIVGGALGVLVGPVMVIVKYLTGWAIVPEPAWISAAKPALGSILSFATPVGLWVFYGRIYTAALLLMLAGIVALALQIRARTGRVRPLGLWVLIAGLCLVIPGDAVHTATWHAERPHGSDARNESRRQHGLRDPHDGDELRSRGRGDDRHLGAAEGDAPACLAWLLLLVTPFAVGLSLTILPTTPGGALWMFSFLMIAVGCSLVFGRPRWQKETA